MTELPLRDMQTLNKLGEDLITFLEIVYQYVHWDQTDSVMRKMKDFLYNLNTCLADSYNVMLSTDFSKFCPYLPTKVNVMHAQILRNINMICHVNRKVDLTKMCPKHYIETNIQLVIMLAHTKCFIAVELTTAKAK